MAHLDVFVEFDSKAEKVTDILPDHLRRHYWANTPPVPLPNGKHFYLLRTQEPGLVALIQDSQLHRTIVGFSWQELWERPYVYRDSVFFASIRRGTDGLVLRVPLAEVRRIDELVERSVRPSGVFAGDGVPEHAIPATLLLGVAEGATARSVVVEKILELKKIVQAANEIDTDDRNKILKYFEACERLLEVTQPDSEAMLRVLHRARQFIAGIPGAFVKAKILQGIEELLKLLL